jgi:hypothetical protein
MHRISGRIIRPFYIRPFYIWPENPAFFLYPAKYQIELPDIRLDIR